MTINFSNMPKRFDAAEGATGIPHRIVDEKGNYYGTYTTSLFDPHSKFIKVEAERHRRKAKADPKSEANGEHANIYAFIQICMKDWSDVPFTDDKGKPLAFSKDNAFKLLTAKVEDEDDQNTIDWLRDEIIKQSRDVLNYQGEPEAEKDDAVKN